MFLILFASLIFGCAQAENAVSNEPAGSAFDDDLNIQDKEVVFPEYVHDLMDGDWDEDVFSNKTDSLPWDIDSLVSIMSKGDSKLTAFIILKIGELRTKTYAQHTVINAKLKRLLAAWTLKRSGARKGKKQSEQADAIYKQGVKDAAYDYSQISQECQSYDRIMDTLNSMKDWKTCQSGWTKVGRSCYKVLSRNSAYLQEWRCLKLGGSLVRVDNADDKLALTRLCSSYKKGFTDTNCQVGFFRELKTGNWNYIDGQSVNPASWYSWAGSNYNKINHNYVGWHGNSKKNYALSYASRWGALCEHRLGVNLLK